MNYLLCFIATVDTMWVISLLRSLIRLYNYQALHYKVNLHLRQQLLSEDTISELEFLGLQVTYLIVKVLNIRTIYSPKIVEQRFYFKKNFLEFSIVRRKNPNISLRKPEPQFSPAKQIIDKYFFLNNGRCQLSE